MSMLESSIAARTAWSICGRVLDFPSCPGCSTFCLNAARLRVIPESGWTKVYFTHRSPKGCLTPTGDLTVKGLFAVLTVLYLEGNYGPVCKKGLALYSNSDRSFAGRYYELSVADLDVLREAAADGILRITSKGDVGAYVDFTDAGLQCVLGNSVPPALAAMLGATDISFLTSASRDVGAVCEVVKGFEEALIKARSLNAPEMMFHNVVSILHKLMLDPKTALEHITRQQNREIRGKPIQSNCSLFDLYVGRNARVLNSFEQGMFMSVFNRNEGSDYRLGKWHGGYNALGDFNPLHHGGKLLSRDEWLDFKLFEVYGDEYAIGPLLDILRNNEVSHSSLSKRTSINRMLEIANRNLRGDGDVGPDDSRGVHETLVYIGHNVGKLLQIVRCWRTAP